MLNIIITFLSVAWPYWIALSIVVAAIPISMAKRFKGPIEYETIIDKLHTVLMNAFRTKGQANTGVPEPVQKILPANVKDKITELYNKCYEQANNDDRDQMEQHKLLINNLYHVYIYDMGSQNEESNKNKKPLIQ